MDAAGSWQNLVNRWAGGENRLKQLQVGRAQQKFNNLADFIGGIAGSAAFGPTGGEVGGRIGESLFGGPQGQTGQLGQGIGSMFSSLLTGGQTLDPNIQQWLASVAGFNPRNTGIWGMITGPQPGELGGALNPQDIAALPNWLQGSTGGVPWISGATYAG
jgi:hypothetical protein